MEEIDNVDDIARAPGAWSLFLDVDGTLLDLAPRPDLVVVPAGLPALLGDLARAFGGALALVSGRPLALIDRLFAPLRLAAAGQHGAEVRPVPAAAPEAAVPPAGLDALRAATAALAAAFPGVLLEEKTHGIAVHYRAAPEREAALRRRLEAVLADAGPAWQLLVGRMVFEVKARRVDKGRAVARLMAVPPFAGRRPLVAGDDITDWDGFAVAAAAGGIALRVGAAGGHPTPWSLPDPPAFRDWLGRLLAAARREGGP
jgi:trehalose 6-phosphate phosphatase